MQLRGEKKNRFPGAFGTSKDAQGPIWIYMKVFYFGMSPKLATLLSVWLPPGDNVSDPVWGVLGYSAGFRVQSTNKCPEQTELG
jgi:hypothetical protein